MAQKETTNLISVTSETKPDKKTTKFPLIYQKYSRTGTIYPGADSGAPRAGTITSREQFKPIRIGENLAM